MLTADLSLKLLGGANLFARALHFSFDPAIIDHGASLDAITCVSWQLLWRGEFIRSGTPFLFWSCDH
jgi:hypothetical protein